MAVEGQHGFRACTGKKSCGYKWTWAGKTRCYNCGKQLPKDIIFKQSSGPSGAGCGRAWHGGVWDTRAKDLPRVPQQVQQVQAPTPIDDVLMDKVSSLEQVKKLLLQAGWGEEDQAFKDVGAKLEEAKQQKIEGRPAWIRHKHTSDKLQRKKKAYDKVAAKKSEAEATLEEAKKLVQKLEEDKAQLALEVKELEEEVKAMGAKLAAEEGAKEGSTPCQSLESALQSELQAIPEELRGTGPLADKLSELKKVVKETADLAAKAQQEQAAKKKEEEQKRQQEQQAAMDAQGDADMGTAVPDEDVDRILHTLIGDGASGLSDDKKKRASQEIMGVVKRIKAASSG